MTSETIGAITRVVLCLAIIILAAWASIAAWLGRTRDTISGHVRDYCAKYPILAVAFGVLIGHWCWPMGPAEPRDLSTLSAWVVGWFQ